MKKIIIILVCLVAAATALYFLKPKSEKDGLKIGIIVPVQHIALDEIVGGFKQELLASMSTQNFTIDVQNAMGDINLQKSAVNKFLNDKVDLLVPVGKGASLMALNLAPKEQSILFLAAFIKPDSKEAQQKQGLMGVIDEIPVELQLKFMKSAMPQLNKFAVIYVSSDKIYDDVKELEEKTTALGITMQKLMVQNVSELYTISSRIEADNQAIFILKDVLVASGVNTLVQQANALKIPLITSDEGTIKNGGAFAVGVTEQDIGRQGARIAAAFFNKQPLEQPIQYLNKISVFINKKSCEAQGVDLAALQQAAQSMNLDIIEG